MTVDELKPIVYDLALRINAPAQYLPIFGYWDDFGHPYIEFGYNATLEYVVKERGRETERKKTQDLNELLYWIFDGVTFEMAIKFELSNRKEDQDFRRIMFAKQEELLGLLNADWQVRKIQEHKRHLPFNDDNQTPAPQKIYYL